MVTNFVSSSSSCGLIYYWLSKHQWYRENILTTYVIDYLSAIAHISWYILMGKFRTRCYKWINIPCDSHKPAAIMCLKRLSTFNDSTSNIIQYFSSVKKRRTIQFKSDKGTQSTLTINRWIYIPITYSVLVHDFVSGRDCCMSQYHYESW
jgi:hypothetical protein